MKKINNTDVNAKNIGEIIEFYGWVSKIRNLGGLIFIDLRDRTGIVQVVFNPDVSKEALAIADGVRSEYVLDVEGKVVLREKGTENPKLKTGKIEIHCEKVSVLKFETFVFDLIPLAKKAIFFETSRNEEFFPLKNKTGIDSIETCIDGQTNLYRSWLKEIGIENTDKIERCEISPLFAPDSKTFQATAKKKLSEIKEMIYENGNIKKEIYIH